MTHRALILFVLVMGSTLWASDGFCAQEGNSVGKIQATLPSDHSEIIAICDSAEHFKSLFQNKGLQQVLSAIADESSGAMTAESLSEQFDAIAPFFPRNIVISGNQSVYEAFGDLAQLILRLNMAVSLSEQAIDVPKADRARLAAELREIAGSFQLPALQLIIDWTDDTTATIVFTLLGGQLENLELDWGLFLDQGEGSYRVRGQLGDFVDPGTIAHLIALAGIPDDDGGLAQIVEMVSFDIRFERIPHGMVIQMGETNPGRPVPEELSEWSAIPGLIAAGRWNLAELKKQADALAESVEDWQKTELGIASQEADIEDVIGGMISMSRSLSQGADAGKFHLTRVGPRFHWELELSGVPPAEPLAGDPLLELIPADIDWYYVESNRDLGTVVAGWIEEAEGRWALDDMRDSWSEDPETVEWAYVLTEGYYRNFGPWRDVMLDQFPKHKLRPWVILGECRGQLHSFRLVIPEEEDLPFELANQTIPEIAAIARATESDSATQVIADAFHQFAHATLTAAGVQAPDGLVTSRTADLGLGRPVTELAFDWISESSLAEWSLDGDFRPHLLTVNDHLLMSTSPRLTRRILDKARPPVDVKSVDLPVVGQGQVTGDALSRNLVGFVSLFLQGVVGPDGLSEDEDFHEMMLVGDLCRLIDVIEWLTVQSDGTEVQTVTVTLTDE